MTVFDNLSSLRVFFLLSMSPSQCLLIETHSHMLHTPNFQIEFEQFLGKSNQRNLSKTPSKFMFKGSAYTLREKNKLIFRFYFFCALFTTGVSFGGFVFLRHLFFVRVATKANKTTLSSSLSLCLSDFYSLHFFLHKILFYACIKRRRGRTMRIRGRKGNN